MCQNTLPPTLMRCRSSVATMLYKVRPMTSQRSSTMATAPASPARAATKKRSSVCKALCTEPARNRVAGDQPFHIAHVARSRTRHRCWNSRTCGPAWPALPFLPRRMLPSTHKPHADTSTPGHVSAIGHTLQRTPAALCFQGAYSVVLYPHVRECGFQGGFEQGGHPVVWANRAPCQPGRHRCWARPTRPCPG